MNEPLEFERAGQRLKYQDSECRHRLQRLSERIHALGPKLLFHFLDEVERGADLRETLETYAALSAELIAAYCGDRCALTIRAIDGGSP